MSRPDARVANVLLAVCAVLALTTVAIAKNGTIGIYAIVDEVEFQPDEQAPERIYIRGVFVVPVPLSSGAYKPPERGYLYFRIPAGMEQVAVREWRELKSFAGTGQGIGFSQYWVGNPHDPSGNPHESLRVQVLRDGEAASPEDYPRPHSKGIVTAGGKSDPDFESIVTKLQKAARE